METAQGNPQNQGQGTESTGAAQGDGQETVSLAQYQGLQKKYQTLFDQHKEKLAELETFGGKVAGLETQLNSLQTQQQQLQGQLDSAQGELGTKDQAIQQLQSEQLRWKLVKDEFSNLVKVAHLVPTGDEETMRSAFKEMAGLVNAMTEEKVAAAMAGVTPQAGGGRAQPATLTDEELWEKIEQTAGTPDGRKWADLWAKRTAPKE